MPSPLQEPSKRGEPKIYEPFDYPTRWLIESSTANHEPYLVDLGAWGCRGECQCRHWVTVVGPKVKKGEWFSCKHINIARERFCNWAIRAFADKDPNRGYDKKQLES